MKNQGPAAAKAIREQWTVILLAGLLVLALVQTGCKTSKPPPPAKLTQHAPPPAESLALRPGDTLKITFPGSPHLDAEQQIQRDGKISLLLAGEVDAAGLTLEELHDKLVKLYESQISSKEVSVMLKSSSYAVYVTGYVMRPGKITCTQPTTVVDAVMEVGVDYSTANLKAVRVLRQKNGVSRHYVVNLREFLDGKDTPPFYLEPEDVIYVPEKLSLF